MSEPKRLVDELGEGNAATRMLVAGAAERPGGEGRSRAARALGIAAAAAVVSGAASTSVGAGAASASGAASGAAGGAQALAGTAGVKVTAGLFGAKAVFVAAVVGAVSIGAAVVAASREPVAVAPPAPPAALSSAPVAPRASAALVQPASSATALAELPEGIVQAPAVPSSAPAASLVPSSLAATPLSASARPPSDLPRDVPVGHGSGHSGDRPASALGAPPTVSALPAPSVPAASSLSDELHLLDEARGHLRAGNAAACLASLDRYAAAHPKGGLGLEARVLRVDALVTSGRIDEARSLAQRTLAESPKGPHAARLQRLVDGR